MNTAAATHFRFFDNREKYLLFVTTCGEKWAIAERLGRELPHLRPRPPALRVFDAGMGDATVLNRAMRDLHRHFPTVPFLVVGKEISLEDVRLSLEKMADRFFEHPQLVLAVTNMNYTEAPSLRPRRPEDASRLKWWTVPLQGNTAHEFDAQIRGLQPRLIEGWQTRTSPRTGNPLYVEPAALVLYRADQQFVLDGAIPAPGGIDAGFDLVIASQPYRARQPAETKVRNVLGPLARALAPGGRMVVVQSTGRDPGMEIVNRLWPGEQPFMTPSHELITELEARLGETMPDLRFTGPDDAASLFRYHLHALPEEIGNNIGTSTLLAAWNAAVYVAQISDAQLTEALESGAYLEATRAVLQRHGGLWFLDESFVAYRQG